MSSLKLSHRFSAQIEETENEAQSKISPSSPFCLSDFCSYKVSPQYMLTDTDKKPNQALSDRIDSDLIGVCLEVEMN